MVRAYVMWADTPGEVKFMAPPGVKAVSEALTVKEFLILDRGAMLDEARAKLAGKFDPDTMTAQDDEAPPAAASKPDDLHIFDDPEAWRGEPDMGNGVDF